MTVSVLQVQYESLQELQAYLEVPLSVGHLVGAQLGHLELLGQGLTSAG